MKYLQILMVLIGFNAGGYSQNLDLNKALRISDSIVISNTSIEFFNYLSRIEEPVSVLRRIPSNINIDRSRLNEREYTKKFEVTTYFVGYNMFLPNGDMFLLKTDTTSAIISWGKPQIGIELDTNYQVLKVPNFNMLQKVQKRIVTATIIEHDTAISNSQPYFTIEKKKIERAVIEYDVTSDLLYWRISKTKGRRKVQEEQVLIDAESGIFIKKEEKEYLVVIAY